MPRKKHLVLVFLLILILLVSVYAYITLKNGRMMLRSDAPQQALLLSSLEQPEFVPSAYVSEDTVREDTRASLIAQLKEYMPENPPAPIDEIGKVESPVAPEVSVVDTVRCVDSNLTTTPIPPWGPINVVRTEDSRVIMSLAQNEFGDPLRLVILPDMPKTVSEPQCLKEGMFGVLLDGRVVTPQDTFGIGAEGILGYARDGFGIFGSVEEGALVTNSNLDQCQGHAHSILWNGVLSNLYHYHVTTDTPHTASCFSGMPVSTHE